MIPEILNSQVIKQDFNSKTGVENVSDHGTIGAKKFLGLPENILIFTSKEFIGQT